MSQTECPISNSSQRAEQPLWAYCYYHWSDEDIQASVGGREIEEQITITANRNSQK
jgi:hypothetical protein